MLPYRIAKFEGIALMLSCNCYLLYSYGHKMRVKIYKTYKNIQSEKLTFSAWLTDHLAIRHNWTSRTMGKSVIQIPKVLIIFGTSIFSRNF